VSWVHSSVEVAELFASLSQPDEFEVQAQLELFAWWRDNAVREWKRLNARRVRDYQRDYQRNYVARHADVRARNKASALKRQKERYASDPEFRERMRQYARDRYARLKRAA
jgi:hypothetical protein